MEFNTLVKAELFPILKKYGFKIAEDSKNIIRLESPVVKINIVFNEHEKRNFIELGRNNEILYPLNDDAISALFNRELELDHIASKKFVENLSVLFQQKEGIEILKGNIKFLIEFVQSQSDKYTSEILHRQVLDESSKAWEKNDYKTFIKCIEQIGFEKVSKLYQLKYKAAKKVTIKSTGFKLHLKRKQTFGV